MNVFELMAKISLDKSEYDEGLSDASKESQSTSSKIGGAFKTAGKVASASFLAIGTAVTATTKKFIDGASSTAQYGDHIDKMSQKLGISAEAYQEWDFIAQHCGTSVDGLQTSMKTLSKAVQDGSEDQVKAFERIGLSMDDVANMSTEELFSNVITGLQGMEEGTERTALASELLGRSATELAPLLNQSAQETANMRQQAHDLGGVMSDEAVKASAQFQDSLQNLQTSISGLRNGALAKFLPFITQIMDGITKIFSGDGSGVQMITDGMNKMADKLIQNLPKFVEVGMKIIESLGTAIINNLPQLIQSAMMIITKLTQMLIENLPLLIKMAPQIIRAIATGIIQAIPQLASSAKQTMISLKDMFLSIDFKSVGSNIIQGIWNGLSGGWNWLLDKVSNLASSLISSAKNALGIHSPSKAFAQIGEYCVEGFDEGMEDLMNADALTKNLKSGLSSIQGDLGGFTFTGSTTNGLADQNVSVNITLAGDADGIFRVVKQESRKFYQSTGRNAFA